MDLRCRLRPETYNNYPSLRVNHLIYSTTITWIAQLLKAMTVPEDAAKNVCMSITRSVRLKFLGCHFIKSGKYMVKEGNSFKKKKQGENMGVL